MQGFSGIQTHDSCFSTASLYQLSYGYPDQFVELILTRERNETKKLMKMMWTAEIQI